MCEKIVSLKKIDNGFFCPFLLHTHDILRTEVWPRNELVIRQSLCANVSITFHVLYIRQLLHFPFQGFSFLTC